MGLPYRLLRTVLFRFDPERAHEWALELATRAGRRRWTRRLIAWMYAFQDLSLRTQAMELEFANPLGLAAGFDKDARAIPALAALGFGHLEVGSVLAHPWQGNPRPRAFRLPADEALVNRFGMPSAGAEEVARSLARVYAGVPVGANLARAGPLPDDDPDEGLHQIVAAARRVAPHASYLVVNASCPNTADGRDLQSPAVLRALLRELFRTLRADGEPAAAGRVLVKLSPDLGEEETERLALLAVEEGARGLVCSNTSARRENLLSSARTLRRLGAGGLSGRPLLEGTRRRIARLRRALGPVPVLVACGGISTGRDVYELLRLGADLCQLYTALVYRGPAAPGRIARELARELHRVGAPDVDAIKGLDA